MPTLATQCKLLQMGAAVLWLAPFASAQLSDYTQKARAADFVFAGTVHSIELKDNIVAIRMRVTDGIKGVGSGDEFVFYEWQGRWRDGARYRIREQLFVFLRKPAASGLTSPVGETGVLRLRSQQVQLPVSGKRSAVRLHTSDRKMAYTAFAREMRAAAFTSQQ